MKRSPEQQLVESARRIQPLRDAVLAGCGLGLLTVLLIVLTGVLLRNSFVYTSRERAEDFALRAAAAVRPGDVTKAPAATTPVDLTDRLKGILADSESIRQVRAYTLEDAVVAAPHHQNAATIRNRILQRIQNGLVHVEGAVSDLLHVPRLLTGYAPLYDQSGNITGIIAVDMVTDLLMHKMFLLYFSTTVAGIIAAALVLLVSRHVFYVRKLDSNSRMQLARAREVEQLAMEGLGEVLYERPCASEEIRWRGNPQLALGKSESEMPTSVAAWNALIHSDDRAKVLLERRKCELSGQPFSLEYRVRDAHNRYRWMLDRAVLVHSEEPTRTWIGALVDVTTRTEADRAIREFIAQNPTSHLVFSGDDLLDANPTAVRAFGADDLGVLLGTPLWKLWPKAQPDGSLSAEAWAEHVLAAFAHSTHHFEWAFRRLDGIEVVMDAFLSKAQFGAREVLLLACYDLSTIKRAQARLIESEQRFRDVSEAIGEYIWEVDQEGNYMFVSPRVREMTGRRPEDVVGRHPFDFAPQSDRAALDSRLDEILETRAPYRDFQYRLVHADGRILWVSVAGVPRFDSLGRVAGYRGATLDITERRTYERELVLQKEAAEAAAHAKSEFLAMMSHEIRTPLNSVLGFADLIRHTPLNETQAEYLETIQRSGDALLVLLNDILDFSRLESGRMTIDLQPTSVRQVISDVVEMYVPACSAKGLQIDTLIDEAVPPYIRTDPARFRQILINLLGNAVKFTPSGGVTIRVTQRADSTETFLRLEVSDTGIGISPDRIDRLFQPFSQADSSTTRHFGGTGLGLAISRRLAILLDGEIGILRTSAEGTTFFLDLPVIIAQPEPVGLLPAPTVDLFPSVAGKRLKVLVVDDNSINRRLTTQMIKQIGDDCDSVDSAAACINQLRHSAYDIVLMDVQMPDMDGLEATMIIRKEEEASSLPRLRIVALTAGAMEGDREACLAAGMDDYLSKPIRRSALEQALNVLRNHT